MIAIAELIAGRLFTASEILAIELGLLAVTIAALRFANRD